MMNLMKSFGQDLMDPSNVKGWPGGVSWITTNTLALQTKYLYQVSTLYVLAVLGYRVKHLNGLQINKHNNEQFIID